MNIVPNNATSAVYQDTFGSANNLAAAGGSYFIYTNTYGLNSIAFQLTIPTGATVTFEGSFDESTYNSVILRRVANDGYVNSTTVSDVYIGSISGMRLFRVRVLVAGSASGSVIGTANSAVSTLEGIENGPPNDFPLNLTESKIANHYVINKFGRNTDVDGEEDIWNGGGAYTGFPTGSAETFQVFSSDANDTSAGTGARTTRWFYLDANMNAFDSTGAFLYFDITMNGVTPVNSIATGKRVYRGLVLTAGSGAINAGTITCRHTTTTANIFCQLPLGFGQTEIAGITIPLGYTGYINHFDCSMGDLTSNSALMAIWQREEGGAVRLQRPFTVSTAYPITRLIYGGLKFIEKTDIMFRCKSVQNPNADISASFDLILVKN